jgi:putative membrane protein
MSDGIETNNRVEGDVWKGLVAGLIGGLVASWTMNRFQDLWMRLSVNDQMTDAQSANGASNEQDDTTVKAASALSEGILGHRLSSNEKKIAGSAVHYSLGTGVGGLYGAAAEVIPEVTTGAGIPFGAAFWLVVDETAVPLLGLSKGPTGYPLSTHLYALTSHFVYGLTAEVIRRAVRRRL